MMEIPHRELSEEALRGVLEEFVTRGGVEHNQSVSQRIETLLRKLEAGRARIVFDPGEGTTNLVEVSAGERPSGHN